MAEKLAEKIYNCIRTEIENGQFDAREFFSEAQLAEKYRVSKATIRDALHLLVGEGFLVSYHRKGYMVNSFSIEEINQIQTIRRSMEHLAAELVIQNATEAEIRSLYGLIDPQGPSDANRAFHLEIAKISGNKYLPEALGGFLSKIYVAMHNDGVDVEKHRAIVEALLARDLDRAVTCLNQDIIFL